MLRRRRVGARLRRGAEGAVQVLRPDRVDQFGRLEAVGEDEPGEVAPLERLAQDGLAVLRVADQHQRLGIAVGGLLQFTAVGRLLLLVGNRGLHAAALLGEGAREGVGQALAVVVVDVDDADPCHALVAGQAGQRDALEGVRRHGAEQEVLVGETGDHRRGRRARDLRHAGDRADRLRDRDRDARRECADESADLLEVDQLLRRVDAGLRVGLGVADHVADAAAGRLDLVRREPDAVQRGLAVGLQIAGHRHQRADLERLLGQDRRGGQERGCESPRPHREPFDGHSLSPWMWDCRTVSSFPASENSTRIAGVANAPRPVRAGKRAPGMRYSGREVASPRPGAKRPRSPRRPPASTRAAGCHASPPT